MEESANAGHGRAVSGPPFLTTYPRLPARLSTSWLPARTAGCTSCGTGTVADGGRGRRCGTRHSKYTLLRCRLLAYVFSSQTTETIR